MGPSLQNSSRTDHLPLAGQQAGLAGFALRRVVALAGPFGSGKTEIAINLASALAASGARVSLADLDVVNPYFRSREAREVLERRGVRLFAPPPEMGFADLPVLAPGVAALISGEDPAILDVGGDAPGARVIGVFSCILRNVSHDVLFVVNASRPYAHTAGAAHLALRAWEEVSGTRVTGIVANAHFLEETSRATVLHGLEVARETARLAGLDVAFAAVTAALAPSLDRELGVPVLPIERHMLPPHLRRTPCRR